MSSPLEPPGCRVGGIRLHRQGQMNFGRVYSRTLSSAAAVRAASHTARHGRRPVEPNTGCLTPTIIVDVAAAADGLVYDAEKLSLVPSIFSRATFPASSTDPATKHHLLVVRVADD